MDSSCVRTTPSFTHWLRCASACGCWLLCCHWGAGGETSPADLRACAFQQLTPGTSTIEDVVRQLGEPAEETSQDEQRQWTYQLEPFAKVEVFLEQDRLTSVVLHLKAPSAPNQIEYELELSQLTPVNVRDSRGTLLGRAYPERGVLLNFAPDSAPRLIAQVVLEPLSAESFLLRVREDAAMRLEKQLADLEIARQLDPTLPEISRLAADVHFAAGDPKRALEELEQYLRHSPDDGAGQVRRAEILVRLDRYEEALERAKDLVEQRLAEPLWQARAEKLLGDLLAAGPTPDFTAAVEHHQSAIRIAAPLANDAEFIRRRAAKELLVETFLSAARAIAAGPWRNPEQAATNWLVSARELADSLVEQDGGSEWWRLRVALGTLTAYAELPVAPPSDPWLAQVTRVIQKLNDSGDDRLLRRELELLRVQALWDAASIAQHRDRPVQARELALQAVRSLESLPSTRELTAAEKYACGRLFFFLGTTEPAGEKQHQAATAQYTRARQYLAAEPPKMVAAELGKHGERWVSMGASYFEAGDRELGVQLTREGLEKMKLAVSRGIFDADRLALPYDNLAAMYRSQGDSAKASEWSEAATRLVSRKSTKPRDSAGKPK